MKLKDLIQQDYEKWLEISKRGPLHPMLRNMETYLKSSQHKNLLEKIANK